MESNSDPVLDELKRRGLLSQYLRLFNADGPVPLPTGFADISDAVASNTSLARWMRALPPSRLADVLGHAYMGKPRIALTAAELDADFDLFPPVEHVAPVAETGAVVAKHKAKHAPPPETEREKKARERLAAIKKGFK